MRPHPHVGLATVTYLFSGELEHRDSRHPVHIGARPGIELTLIAGQGFGLESPVPGETEFIPLP